MPQMAEKTEPDAPPNCAVVPKKMRAMFTLRPQAEGLFRQSAPRGSGHVSPPPSAANHPRAKPPNGLWTRALSMRAFPYFSASVSSPNHSGRWKSGRKWTMGAQEPKWGWIVSSHL